MALTNAQRQARFRARQRGAAVELDELAALTTLLDSPAAAGAILECFGDLRSATAAASGEVRACLPRSTDGDRVMGKLEALRVAALALSKGGGSE